MTTALDLITGALRKINVLAAGEVPSGQEQQDALAVLNDLLDTWSTEHLTVFNNNENILILTAGKFSYTVGNPVAGTFSGTTSPGSAVITGVTPPAPLVLGASLIAPGIPAAAIVIAIGVSTVTMSLPATGGFSQLITFTAPGDFPIPRPLRLTNVYTRITANGSTGIDYPCDIWSGDQYTAIGLKSQPGPWPKGVYYNENFPLGQMLIWPVPTIGGEFHMWTDDVFTLFTGLTDVVQLPQGYARALKLALALELGPEYGKKIDPLLVDQAKRAKSALKALNASPQSPASYDPAIGHSNRMDAGWILHGGFR